MLDQRQNPISTFVSHKLATFLAVRKVNPTAEVENDEDRLKWDKQLQKRVGTMYFCSTAKVGLVPYIYNGLEK